MRPRFPVVGSISRVLPFVFAPLLGACEGGDDPVVAKATCALGDEGSLPGPVEVVAVDRGGSVHAASSSSYWVRSDGGGWTEQALFFGAPYAAYLHVAARGDELVVAHAVALTRNLGDLVHGCHPPAGNTGGCWVGWDGERRSEHEIYLAQGAPDALPPMRILEGIAEMGAFHVDALRSESGDVHVVAGSTYARFGCGEATP